MKEIIEYLPEWWEKAAKETGALQRTREIKNAEELLALNMLYISNDGSISSASAAMRLMKGISINKNATYKRIKASGEWLRVMAEELCKQQGSIEKPVFLTDKNVIIVDASAEMNKGKTTEWRLHYAFDLFNFKNKSLELTTNKEGERLTRYNIEKNEIWIGDRAYGTVTGIEHVKQAGGDFVVRIKSKAFNLFNEKGDKIEILDHVRGLKAFESMEINCFYKAEDKIMKPLRMVVMRKDEEAINETKRKVKRKGSKNGWLLHVKSEELNEYIVLATSLDYTNEQILELYRARWQIEKVFHRLKSLFGYGNTPCKNEAAIMAWYYGKLFLASLCEYILKLKTFSPDTENFIVDIITAKLVV